MAADQSMLLSLLPDTIINTDDEAGPAAAAAAAARRCRLVALYINMLLPSITAAVTAYRRPHIFSLSLPPCRVRGARHAAEAPDSGRQRRGCGAQIASQRPHRRRRCRHRTARGAGGAGAAAERVGRGGGVPRPRLRPAPLSLPPRRRRPRGHPLLPATLPTSAVSHIPLFPRTLLLRSPLHPRRQRSAARHCPAEPAGLGRAARESTRPAGAREAVPGPARPSRRDGTHRFDGGGGAERDEGTRGRGAGRIEKWSKRMHLHRR